MHDGSTCASASSPAISTHQRQAALNMLESADAKGEVVTGVLYVNTAKPTFLDC